MDEDLSRRFLLGAVAGAGVGLASGSAFAADAEPPMEMEEPTVKVGLEHAFDIRIDFAPRWLSGDLPWGAKQGYTPIGPRGGIIRGPKLNGSVIPGSGADFAQVRSDGVVEFDAQYLLEADDGTKIFIHNTGYGAKGYFRATPRFRVEKGPHDWLNWTVIVGSGEPKKAPVDHSIFRYSIVP